MRFILICCLVSFSCLFSQSTVVWDNLKNVSVSNNVITKLTGVRGQATSKNMLYGTLSTQINDGGFSFQTGGVQNENKLIGFVIIETADTYYESIDYGFSFQNNKVKLFGKEGYTEQIYNGIQNYKIERLNDQMLYYINEQLIYQEKVDYSEYLVIRAQLKSNNSSFSSVGLTFNTSRIDFNPLINFQTLQVDLNLGNQFNNVSWSDGEKTFVSRKYIKDKYVVRLKNANGNEIDRIVDLGSQVNWQQFSNGVQQNGISISKISGNNWGSAISNTTFASTESCSFALPFNSQNESKIIGFSNDYQNIQNINNCWAGFFIANDFQLKIIFQGNIVKTVEAFQNDHIALYYKKGKLSWELNGLVIYELLTNYSGNFKLISLLRNNTNFYDVFFNVEDQAYITTEISIDNPVESTIKLDLRSLSNSISTPYKYYISDEIIPSYSELDSNYIEQSHLFDNPNANTYNYPFLEFGRYFVSVFGPNGERILGKYIDVQPDLNFIENSGLLKNGNSFFHDNNQTTAVLSQEFDFKKDVTVHFVNNDGQGAKYFGLVDKNGPFNSYGNIKYGYEIKNDKLAIIEDGQINSEKFFLRENKKLSIEVTRTELKFISDREVLKRVVFVSDPNLRIGISRNFGGEIKERPGDGIIIINKQPKEPKKLPSYQFIYEDTKATCTNRFGSVRFKFKSSDRLNEVSFSIYDESNTEVASSSSLSENTFYDFQSKLVGMYSIVGSVRYITGNGPQLQFETNLFQEYIFIGINANLISNNILGLDRGLSDFVITPEETGFIRFNPNILNSNNDLLGGGVDQNNLTQIFKNIFYLTTNRSHSASNNLDKYIAFRNVRYPIDPVFPNQNVTNPTRLNVHWGTDPLGTFTVFSNSTDTDPYITVLFKTSTIEFFYSTKFSPSTPFLVIPRETSKFYSFGNNISMGEQVDMYHSFKCHPKECTAIINQPDPICAGQQAQLSVENLLLSDKLTFSWSPSTNLSCSNCLTPVATPTSSIEYFFHYTNGIECPAIPVKIEVLTGNECYKVYCESHIVMTPNVPQYCPGDVLLLEVVNNHGFDLTNVPMIWTPNENMSCPTCYQTSVVPTFEGVFRVTYTINGVTCNEIRSTNIKINEKLCENQPDVVSIDGCCFSNYGAGVYVNQGTKLNVFCNIINEISLVDNQIEKGEFTNKGEIASSKDWVNNGQNNLFNSYEGQTRLIGSYQRIRGNSSIYYYDLFLDGGTSIKEIYNDEYVVNSLSINNAELATKNNTFELLNVDPVSLNRLNGIISTDLSNGFFSRKMVDNQTLKYLFPMGSSQSTYRYRPLELNSLQANLDFKVNFVNQVIPSSLNTTQLAPNVESVYDQYFYKFQSPFNLPNIRITAYFDPAQGNFQAISHWATSNVTTPVQWWESTPGISSSSTPSNQSNTFGLVSASSSGTIDLNTENFSLAKAGFYINTDGFGDPGDVIVVTPVLPGDTNGNGTIDPGETPGDTNGNGTIDPGELPGDTNGNGTIDPGEVPGDSDGNGVIDGTEVEGNGGVGTTGGVGEPNGTGTEVTLTPNPVPGTYVIDIQSGDCTVPGKIKFTVNTDGFIDPNSVIYLNEGELISSTVNKLAGDLYDVDTENSGISLYSKPKSMEECINAVSVYMGSPNQTANEFIILNSNPVGTNLSSIDENIYIKGLNSDVVFTEFYIDGINLSNTAIPSSQVIGTISYSVVNITGFDFSDTEKGSHRFELKVFINGSPVPTSIFGQLIIK